MIVWLFFWRTLEVLLSPLYMTTFETWESKQSDGVSVQDIAEADFAVHLGLEVMTRNLPEKLAQEVRERIHTNASHDQAVLLARGMPYVEIGGDAI